MIQYYAQIKSIHVACVLASGVLFMARGLLISSGHTVLAHRRGVRWLAYSIDTCLLIAALLMVSILPSAVFANGWLTVKLILIVVYVFLGTLALKRGRTPGIRRACYIAGLLTYVFIIGIARNHEPLGWLYPWFS